MKRIQIIFILLISLTVLSVITGKKNPYYSEYDSRFICSLKFDLDLFDYISEEMNRGESSNEISSVTTGAGHNTHSRIELGKNSSFAVLLPLLASQFFNSAENIYKKTSREHSTGPRAPPIFS